MRLANLNETEREGLGYSDEFISNYLMTRAFKPKLIQGKLQEKSGKIGYVIGYESF
jgi:hypothetical protein